MNNKHISIKTTEMGLYFPPVWFSFSRGFIPENLIHVHVFTHTRGTFTFFTFLEGPKDTLGTIQETQIAFPCVLERISFSIFLPCAILQQEAACLTTESRRQVHAIKLNQNLHLKLKKKVFELVDSIRCGGSPTYLVILYI